MRASESAGLHARVRITPDPEVVRAADKVVVPGQGAFRDCARAFGAGMGEVLRERIAAGTPYLGICLGLQVLFGASEEAPGEAGLGVFEGEVVKLAGGVAPDGTKLKVPHVGWNTAEPGPAESALAKALLPQSPTYFYFVHSFAVVPRDPRIVAATTSYGTPFVSAVARDNVIAVQFHPEKSQGEGLAFLTAFVKR